MGSNPVTVANPVTSETPNRHLESLQAGGTWASEPHSHHNGFLPHLPSAFILSSSSQAPPLDHDRLTRISAADHPSLAVASSATMQESTPPQQDSSASSPLEKKRNKLGYHRTSVACVHCRRRKIRCLVDANDQQGRCQNCIRLKKECNFFPVDQQPPNERQRRSAPKASPQVPDPSAPSNRGPGDGYQYTPSPMGYPPAAGAIPGGPMPITLDTGGFGPPMRNSTWDNAGYIDEPLSAPGHMSDTGTPGFWAYGNGPDSARSAQFPSTFGPGRQESWPGQAPHQSHQSQPMHTMGPVQAGQPTRSMSLQHDGQGVYGGAPMHNGAFFDGRGGPPSLNNSNGSPATTVSLDGTTAPGQAPPVMHYGIPQWDPSKEYVGSGGEMGPGWFPNTVPSMPEDGPQNWQQAQHGQPGYKAT